MGRFQQPKTEKTQPKKASELTFKKPKQEKPDIQSTNLTQDEPVLCFNEDSPHQSLVMCSVQHRSISEKNYVKSSQ